MCEKLKRVYPKNLKMFDGGRLQVVWEVSALKGDSNIDDGVKIRVLEVGEGYIRVVALSIRKKFSICDVEERRLDNNSALDSMEFLLQILSEYHCCTCRTEEVITEMFKEVHTRQVFAYLDNGWPN